jgi:hypothetical protein
MKKLFLFVALFSLICLNTFGQSKKMQLSIDSCKMVIEQQASKIAELDTKLNNLYAILGVLRNSLNDLPKGMLLVPSNALNVKENAGATDENQKSTVGAPGQCKALTKAGSRCKRMASTGTEFCWQHQSSRSGVVSEENKGSNESSEISVKTTPTQTQTQTQTTTPASSYSGSRTIQTGSRGGQYYINSNGNKTYIKKK